MSQESGGSKPMAAGDMHSAKATTVAAAGWAAASPVSKGHQAAQTQALAILQSLVAGTEFRPNTKQSLPGVSANGHVTF